MEWARAAVRESASPRTKTGDAGKGAIRVLDPELLHVTLCFLGSRPVDEIEEIAQRLAACERPAADLSLGAHLWLPIRRPRALTVEVHDDDGRLARLHASVETALGDGRARGARHRFRPHVTVARMRGDALARERVLPPTPALRFTTEQVVLYRSWLAPDGASYEPLASYALA